MRRPRECPPRCFVLIRRLPNPSLAAQGPWYRVVLMWQNASFREFQNILELLQEWRWRVWVEKAWPEMRAVRTRTEQRTYALTQVPATSAPKGMERRSLLRNCCMIFREWVWYRFQGGKLRWRGCGRRGMIRWWGTRESEDVLWWNGLRCSRQWCVVCVYVCVCIYTDRIY